MILSVSQQGLFLALNPFQTDNISRHWRMSVIGLESHVTPPKRILRSLFISRFQLDGNCHLSIPYVLKVTGVWTRILRAQGFIPKSGLE